MILLAVRNPNIFYRGGVLKKPAPLGQFRVEPVDGAAFVRPNLFQIAHRHRLGRRRIRFVTKAPDRIDVVMFSERF